MKRINVLCKWKDLRKCWRLIFRLSSAIKQAGTQISLFISPRLPYPCEAKVVIQYVKWNISMFNCWMLAFRKMSWLVSLSGDHFHVSLKITFINRNVCVGSLSWQNRKDVKVVLYRLVRTSIMPFLKWS